MAKYKSVPTRIPGDIIEHLEQFVEVGRDLTLPDLLRKALGMPVRKPQTIFKKDPNYVELKGSPELVEKIWDELNSKK